MAAMSITVKVKFAWWLKPYLYFLTAWCWTFNRDVNMDHVDRCIDRAARFTIKD